MERDANRETRVVPQKTDYTGTIIAIVILVVLLLILFGTALGASMLTGIGLRDDMDENTASSTDRDGLDNENSQGAIPGTSATPTSTAQNPDDVAFRINTSSLSEEQRAMLRAVGITGEEIEITNKMKLCAENSIGADRTEEIAGGAAPSIMESTKLMACYNA